MIGTAGTASRHTAASEEALDREVEAIGEDRAGRVRGRRYGPSR